MTPSKSAPKRKSSASRPSPKKKAPSAKPKKAAPRPSKPAKPAAKPSAKATPKPSAKVAMPEVVPELSAVPVVLTNDPLRILSLAFVRDGDEFLARLESAGGHITELKNRSLDQLLTMVAGELEDLLG